MPLFTAVLLDRPDTLSRKVLSAAPMVLIGRLSYSIYLFHLLALTPGELVFGSPWGIGSIVSGLIITGIIAYTLLIFVELPLGKLRHRLRGKESGVAAVKPLNPQQLSMALDFPQWHRKIPQFGGLAISREMDRHLRSLVVAHDQHSRRIQHRR